jgi:hypothetical protein
MTHNFKDKVQFDADLLKNQDSFEWEQTVAATLNRLWASYTGRNVLDELGLSPNIVKIVPYYDLRDPMNANSEPRNDQDAYYPGRPLRSARTGHLDPGAGVGTGRGSAVRLNYSPWRFPKTLQPVVLVHEMVHAAEQQRGMVFMNTVHSACFDTVAEFDAIVVENIYRSEIGMELAKDHHRRYPMAGNRMLPQEGELRARLESFRARMPHLTRALAQVQVRFNPLRTGNAAYA